MGKGQVDVQQLRQYFFPAFTCLNDTETGLLISLLGG